MKQLYALLLFILCNSPLFAQLPPACTTQNPPLAKTCSQACILCNLDGYTSMTTQSVQGQTIPGFCTFVVHSMGYIGFVAGSTDLTIQVAVGGCTLGNSIEMGIYQTDDCQTFNLVSECNTEMFTNTTYTFSNTEPLHPGCPYFMAFDNNGPASCSFTVTVLSGSATAPPVAAPAVPEGPTKLCPGATAVYTIPPIDGACHYRWTAPPGATINGMTSPVLLDHENGTTVTVTWGSQGGQLCVRGQNPCNNGPNACLPVMVAPIPPTVLPAVSICNGSGYEWLDGNVYSSNQLLTFTYQTAQGCDSTVNQQLSVKPPIVTNLGTKRLCEGECFTVGTNKYCKTGAYQEVLNSAAGCDSTVFFSIIVIPAVASITPPDTLTCLKDTIVLDGNGSSSGVDFTWQNAAGTTLSTDPTLLVHQNGLYRLIIRRVVSGLTCLDTATVNVVANTQAPLLSAQGDTVTCKKTLALLNGGPPAPGVSFNWTGPNGFTAPTKDTSSTFTGAFILTATGANGCSGRDTAQVVADTLSPILILATPDTLSCAQDSVSLSASANLPGVTFAWTGPQGFSTTSANPWTKFAGLYTAVATNTNGCRDSAMLTVPLDTLPPHVTAGGGTLTCALDTIALSASASGGATLQWTGPQNFSATALQPSVTLPGSYTLTATAANGCTASASAQVGIDTLAPQISAGGGTLTCAVNALQLTSTVSPANIPLQWNGPQGFSSTQANPSANLPGMYTLTATNTNGCTASVSIQVNEDTAPPQATASGGNLTCTQNATTLSLIFSPASSSVLWTGPQNFSTTNPAPAVSIAGNYVATVTAPNGCTATATATVAADASIPQVSAGGGTLTCAQPALTLSSSIPAGSTLLWSGPQGFSSNAAQPTVTLPGVYTLLASTPNGCTASASATVNQDVQTPLIQVGGGILTCAQSTVNLSSAVAPASATIQWAGPQGFTSGSPAPSVSAAGTYTLAATAPNGCTASATATVGADVAPPTVSASGGIFTCAQPLAPLSGSVSPSSAAALWSGPQGFSYNGLNTSAGIAGQYLLTATAPNGCTATATATVSADLAPPNVSASGGIFTCAQPLAPLSGSVSPSPVSVLWSGPQGFSNTNLNASAGIAGQYLLTATGPNGCTASATATLTSDTLPPQISTAGGTVTCANPAIVLTSTANPINAALAWAGPQNFSSAAANPTVAVPGTYLLIATGPNGCTASSQAQVSADTTAPAVTASGGLLTCLQPSLNLSASVSPANCTVLWNGPQGFSSPLLNPQINTIGNYTLTATAPNGCTATATANVQIDSSFPQITASGGTLNCKKTSLPLVATVSPANSSLLWSGPQNFSATALQPVVTVPGTYTLTATTPAGCTSSATALVVIDTVAPSLKASGGTVTCAQPTTVLQANVSPAGSTLAWQGPQNFSASLANPTASLPGPYSVTAQGPNGCTAVASTQVQADTSKPSLSASGGIITCSQPSVQLNLNVAPANCTVKWTGPQNFSSTQVNPVASLAGTYTATATAPNGCQAKATAQVSADVGVPQISLSGGILSCAQPALTLTATVSPVGSALIWSGPQNFSANIPNPGVTTPGTYTLTASTPNGCTATSSLLVPADTTKPSLQIKGGIITCVQDIVVLNATFAPENSTILWKGPQNFTATGSTAPTTLPGTYTATITAPNGCTASAQTAVSEQTKPSWTLTLGPDTLVVAFEVVVPHLSTNLPAAKQAGVSWTFPANALGDPCNACPFPWIKLPESGSVMVQVTDLFGCAQSDTLFIAVQENDIYVPNVFTPEIAGPNQFFQIFVGPKARVTRIRSFRIYDRWGSLVHERLDFLPNAPDHVWDGQEGGKAALPGVYTWYAEIETEVGKPRRLWGDVTLLR